MKRTKRFAGDKLMVVGNRAVLDEDSERYYLPIMCIRCRDVLGHCDESTSELKGELAPHTLEDCVLTLGLTVQGLVDRLLHHKLL